MQVVFPGGCIPSDKSVPDSNVPWRGRPEQASNGPPMGKGHVLEMLSHRLGIAQIMILADEAVTKLLLRGPSDLLQMQGGKLREGASDGRLINPDVDRHFSLCQGIGGPASGRRQLDPSLGLEQQQQAAAYHVLESAIGLPPIPGPANFLGDETPAAIWMSCYNSLDNGNI